MVMHVPVCVMNVIAVQWRAWDGRAQIGHLIYAQVCYAYNLYARARAWDSYMLMYVHFLYIPKCRKNNSNAVIAQYSSSQDNTHALAAVSTIRTDAISRQTGAARRN